MAQRKQDEDMKVVEDIRPSQNYIKRDPPPHTEKRVTQEEIEKLQDPANPDTNMIGFRPHRINGIVPVNRTTGAIIPAADGTVGVALFKIENKAKKLMEEKREKELADAKAEAEAAKEELKKVKAAGAEKEAKQAKKEDGGK